MQKFLAELLEDGALLSFGVEPVVTDSLVIYFKGYIANKSNILFQQNNIEQDLNQNINCIAKSYRKWGKNLNKYVFGEFAVGIYDIKTKTLTLIQDCLGIVPLYYSVNHKKFTYSSCINYLSQVITQSGLDEEYISDYLCFGSHYGEKTPYKNINKLVPGVTIQFSNGKLRQYHNWALENITPVLYKRESDYIDELEYLITEGIKSALPTNGITLCEVSGGLDSSTVACIASRHIQPDKLQALSFVYSESHTADESIWSKKVVDACNLKWHKLDLDHARQFTELPSEPSGQPYHTMVNVASTNLYKNLINDNNISVVLTGAGGDGVLLGDGPDPFFFADMLRSGQFINVYKGLSQWAKNSKEPRPFLYWLNKFAITPCISKFKNCLIYDEPRKISWISTNYQFAKKNGSYKKSWVPKSSSFAEAWYLEQILRSSKFVSLRDETQSMNAEFRNPLMYLPLVKFMCATPWDIKFSPNKDRLWHRQAVSNILPKDIVMRETKGSPSQAVYAGLEKGQWWKEINSGTNIVARGYVNPKKWKDAVGLARLGRCESIMHFKAAATLEVWLQNLERRHL